MSDQNPKSNKKPSGDKGQGMKPGKVLIMWIAAFILIMVMLKLVSEGKPSLLKGKRTLQLNEFWALLNNNQIKRLTFNGPVEGEAEVQMWIEKTNADNEQKNYILLMEETDRQMIVIPLDSSGDEIRQLPLAMKGELQKEPYQARVLFLEGYLNDNLERIRGRLGPNNFVYNPRPFPYKQVLFSLAPWILFFIIIWFLVLRQMRSPGGSSVLSFGKSRARMANKTGQNVTFDDVAGINEAKEEVREIIEFLRNPEKFQRLGGRIPRGILLVGSPGTGKTLLAKAIAGEADVPFFSISGSDFVEMFVGIGASRVRDLFRQAKENSPCMIFLDEVDAVGRRRGAGLGGGHDEREQTLNAILVEMDGFETDSGVILIASTNRPDVLDPALLRPGRFDRQVVVDLPDVKGREAILKVHARDKKLSPDVDLAKVAKSTPFFSGADLENLMNEGALLAAMKDQNAIYPKDLEEARDKVQYGREKKSRLLHEEEKKVSAYHETGHALVALLTPGSDPLHKVTIIPRGMALGATHFIPERDHQLMSRKKILGDLRVLLAGRAAEELFLDDITSGAQNDFERATELARLMICKWGMSKSLGPVSYSENEDNVFLGRDITRVKSVSEETAIAIDKEIKELLERGYEEAKELLGQRREEVEAITQGLFKYETLDAEEVQALMRGEELNRPDDDFDPAALSDQAESEDTETESSEDINTESEEMDESDSSDEETPSEPAEATADSVAGNEETKSD
ncbi:MAG: ATP-dependent zinc metalloprotease FtsH [Planctomycetota bacterium]|jgi:cell division protease FtsH|nr:ATP-dependent zinc metalloprotease FtsH [Planctomycetota bacterium]MDP7250891.1 ATP-dependent zinc metalloprotease FtsH [Planctomycetota bacterium]